MPTLNRACSYQRCPHPAERGTRFCVHHRREKQDAWNRPSAAARGYDRKWRRIRSAFLARNPACASCGHMATEVDHITPLASGGTHDTRNLQSLCKRCHSAKTMRENRGAGGQLRPRGRGASIMGGEGAVDRRGSEKSSVSGFDPELAGGGR